MTHCPSSEASRVSAAWKKPSHGRPPPACLQMRPSWSPAHVGTAPRGLSQSNHGRCAIPPWSHYRESYCLTMACLKWGCGRSPVRSVYRSPCRSPAPAHRSPSARGQHKSQQRTWARTCCGRGGVVSSSAAKATTSDSSTLSAVTAAVAFVGFELVAFVFLSPGLDGLDLLPLPKPAEILPPAMPLVRCPRSGAGNGNACTTHAWTLRPCRAASGPL